MSQVIVLEISVSEEIAVYRSHQFHSNTQFEQGKRNQQTAKKGKRYLGSTLLKNPGLVAWEQYIGTTLQAIPKDITGMDDILNKLPFVSVSVLILRKFTLLLLLKGVNW